MTTLTRTMVREGLNTVRNTEYHSHAQFRAALLALFGRNDWAVQDLCHKSPLPSMSEAWLYRTVSRSSAKGWLVLKHCSGLNRLASRTLN